MGQQSLTTHQYLAIDIPLTHILKTTTRKKYNRQTWVLVFFVIKGKRQFSNIKNDVYEFLIENSFWLVQIPGPATKTGLRGLGVITHVPTGTNIKNIQIEIHNAITEHTTQQDNVMGEI